MSGSFEDQFKSYMSAIMAVHSKYSSKKVHDKSVEISNDVASIVFDAVQQLNPDVMDTLNAIELAPITDAFVAQYKTKTKKVSKKVAKSLNVYTSIFIPIVRKVAEPILKQWDTEEPDVVYNRITSINSIASKIYKNLTDKSKYTDTYEYQPDTVEGKTKGVIVSNASNPDDFDALVEQYGDMINTLNEDKKAIQEELKDVPDDQIKEKKAELIQMFMEQHMNEYSLINDYIMTFMDNYRTVLKEMCIDKPVKRAKKTAAPKKQESINMDEDDEGIDVDGNPETFSLPPPVDMLVPEEEVIDIPAAPVLPPEKPAKTKQLPTIKPVEQAPVVKKTRKTTGKKNTTRKN